MENAMMQDWNDFLPPELSTKISSSLNRNPSEVYGAFQGASNCTFNINIYNGNQSPPVKHKRIIIDDDDE